MAGVVDVIVRSLESRAVLLATHDPEVTGEGLFLGRVVHARGGLDVALAISPEEIATLRWEEEPGAHASAIRIFTDDDPDARTYRFVVQRAPAPDWEAWVGMYSDGEAPFQITAFSDPEPTLIIAGIAAAACLLKIGVERLLNDCEQQLTDLARDCIERGGSPKYKIHSTFGVKLKPFAIGCARTCEFEGCTLP